jgi:TonB family protein
MTAIQALQMWTQQYDTSRNEAMSLTFATALHLLLFLWNPNLLTSELQAIKDPLVEVAMVDMAQGPGGAVAEPPKKMSLLDTLKDMMKTPTPMGENAAHIPPPAAAPTAPLPPTPTLQERTMPKPITSNFQPRSQMDDIAALKSQAPIQTPNNIAQMPNTAPSLKSKAFSGIQAKDLPFEMSRTGNEAISGNTGAVPIAVGRSSIKEANAGLSGPTLQQTNRARTLTQRPGTFSGTDTGSLSAASSQAPAVITGAGSAGVAPTGPATGTLSQKQGGGSLVGRKLVGQGSGNVYGTGGVITRTQEQANTLSSNESDRKIAKPKSGNIEGEIANRGVVRKVIPQYPAWAEEQGIVGTLKLFFTVSPEGNVRPNITVRQTTGYPALDQLGIDALKQWKFVPHAGGSDAKDQWGVITFVFSLAS